MYMCRYILFLEFYFFYFCDKLVLLFCTLFCTFNVIRTEMATSKIYLDALRMTDSFGVIKILVIHNRVQRMYSKCIKIKESDFKKFQSQVTEDGLSSKVKNEETILFSAYFMERHCFVKRNLRDIY